MCDEKKTHYLLWTHPSYNDFLCFFECFVSILSLGILLCWRFIYCSKVNSILLSCYWLPYNIIHQPCVIKDLIPLEFWCDDLTVLKLPPRHRRLVFSDGGDARGGRGAARIAPVRAASGSPDQPRGGGGARLPAPRVRWGRLRHRGLVLCGASYIIIL